MPIADSRPNHADPSSFEISAAHDTIGIHGFDSHHLAKKKEEVSWNGDGDRCRGRHV